MQLSSRAIPEVAPLFDELIDCGPLTRREVVGDVGSGSRLHDGTVVSPKGRNVYEGMKELVHS